MQTQPPAVNQAPYPYTQQPDDEINLLELWQAIWQRKLILFTTVLISIALGLAYIAITPPVYQAKALLAPTTAQKSTGRLAALASQYSGLAGLSGIAFPTHSSLNTAIATLESRRFIQAFIQDNHLKPRLFPGQWDTNSQAWIPRQEPDNKWWEFWRLPSDKAEEQSDTFEPNPERAYQTFRNALSVSIDKKTGLVNLQIKWTEPRPTAEWANQLVGRINQILRKQAIEKAKSSMDYLKQQLETARLDELKVVYAELIQEQTKNITLAQANEEYAFEILDPAVAPGHPIRPKRQMIMLLSLIAGLVIGIIIALVGNAVHNHKRKMALANTPQHLTP